jgi:hypothetical protein
MKLFSVILALFTLAISAQAQPVNVVGARIGYDGYATPATSGGLFYAHLLAGSDHPTYSYTSVNLQPLKAKPYISMTTTETGVAQHIAKFGRFNVYGLGTVGGAFAGSDSGTNIGAVFSGGGFALASFGKGWTVGPYVRASKASISDRQYEFGLVFGWGK